MEQSVQKYIEKSHKKVRTINRAGTGFATDPFPEYGKMTVSSTAGQFTLSIWYTLLARGVRR
jgi:hypothetical protein